MERPPQKQGYIHLLPYMLKFLEGTRQIVRYHDVTPGSQITWNTAFLAVTGAWKRGGEEEVRFLLEVLNEVTRTPESELSSEMRKARLNIYQDCNDAFRKLLLGKFGRLPLASPRTGSTRAPLAPSGRAPSPTVRKSRLWKACRT